MAVGIEAADSEPTSRRRTSDDRLTKDALWKLLHPIVWAQSLLQGFIIALRFWLDIAHYTILVAIIDGFRFLCALLLPWQQNAHSLNSINVAVETTPTFFRAFWQHMRLKSTGRIKAGQDLSYTEGLALVKEFLAFSSTHTVEELQSFTGKETPTPTWINRTVVEIPVDSLDAAAELLRKHLEQDDPGLKEIGGANWWRLRCRPLFGEWIEMKRGAVKRDSARRNGEAVPPEKVILYLHGGAHYFAGNGTHRYQIQRHARKLSAKAFSVSFRLAPQYPFPCSLLDALAAYLYLIAPPPDAEVEAIHPHQIMLYGDSSGGGLAVALLVLLRDAKLPLPAGCVLLSPWVDLTHSFPSVMGDPTGDYIPAEGFQFKPSLAWPPTREEPLVFQNGCKRLVVEEQIQLYCTNYLVGHPMVSPINQGSLGGLPPMLIIAGSAELIRDEIIYLAHKAARPEKYPPAEATLRKYPAQREKISEYPPTMVQFQVFDDCCHVATTLSFCTPAKFQYRSCANFSLWALKAAEEKANETSEIELSRVSEGQHHYDYATQRKAEAPPRHSSPPKYRLPPLRHSAAYPSKRVEESQTVEPEASSESPSHGFVNGHAASPKDDKEGKARERRRSVMDRLRQLPGEAAEPVSQETVEAVDGSNEGLVDLPEASEIEDDSECESLEAERITLSRGTSSTSVEQSFQLNPHENSQDVAEQITVNGQMPHFKESMVRQRVTPDGFIREMECEDKLDALTMPREQVGQVSPDGPVWRWLEKRRVWDRRYRRDLIYYRKLRMKDRKKAEQAGYLSRDLQDERPPMSSVAGMYDEKLAWQTVKPQDTSIGHDGQTERAGLGMLLWSKLSSKPDAEQQGWQTLDELAKKGDKKLKRRPSSIKTPDIEKELYQQSA